MKWQPQVEKRQLAIMLQDKKVVVPVLEYLKTIDIKGRK